MRNFVALRGVDGAESSVCDVGVDGHPALVSYASQIGSSSVVVFQCSLA